MKVKELARLLTEFLQSKDVTEDGDVMIAILSNNGETYVAVDTGAAGCYPAGNQLNLWADSRRIVIRPKEGLTP
jgi:hypothetical protein